MKNNRGLAKTPTPTVIGLIAGLTLAELLMVLVCCSYAALLSKNVISWEAVDRGLPICVFVCAFTGTWSAARMLRNRRVIAVLTECVLLLGVHLGMATLVFGAWNKLVCMGCMMIVAGSAAALLSSHKRQRKTGNRRGRKR